MKGSCGAGCAHASLPIRIVCSHPLFLRPRGERVSFCPFVVDCILRHQVFIPAHNKREMSNCQQRDVDDETERGSLKFEALSPICASWENLFTLGTCKLAARKIAHQHYLAPRERQRSRQRQSELIAAQTNTYVVVANANVYSATAPFKKVKFGTCKWEKYWCLLQN